MRQTISIRCGVTSTAISELTCWACTIRKHTGKSPESPEKLEGFESLEGLESLESPEYLESLESPGSSESRESSGEGVLDGCQRPDLDCKRFKNNAGEDP